MKVLFYPSLKKGQGSGHLRRSLALVKQLGHRGFLLLEDCLAESGRDREEVLKELDYPKSNIRERYNPDEHWDLIVMDRKSTDPSELERFARRALVIGIDEGGKAREYFPYLIDLLPGITKVHPPNLSSISLLDLPERSAKPLQYPFRKILISFGGEDPADLSRRLLKVLLTGSLFPPQAVTVVEGPFFSGKNWPAGIKVLTGIKDLKSRLKDYDLLFTSFGLTCFEALAAGVPVILLNPTPNHRKLSRKANIPEVGVRTPGRRKLKRLLADKKGLEEPLSSFDPALHSKDSSISTLFESIQPVKASCCPVCRKALNPAVERFQNRTYFRCKTCGIIYLLKLGAGMKRYEEDYFFREYKSQYGRTYLEDFENIKNKAGRRLAEIKSILGGLKDKSLLDVGCAYGPFLKAAQKAGFKPLGLDISAQAVKYVSGTLNIPCLRGNFMELKNRRLIQDGFDVLTMWFVIEHFDRLDTVLYRVNELLRRGGVFAFSTPNGRGISARKSRHIFLEKSPLDHCTLWRPAAVRTILAQFGFRLRKCQITGHHPERFPWFAARGLKPAGTWEALLSAASKIFRLGDTFEVYAEKLHSLNGGHGGNK
ncbi:Ubiquinone biosynthesis O-methyltransferase [subsurface metagenome]